MRKKSTIQKAKSAKKGKKKSIRAKISKKHLEERKVQIEAQKKRREKEYLEYYNNLITGKR